MTLVVPWENSTVTIHDWDAWVDPKVPVVGPAMTWEDNTTLAVHYTAAVNLPDGDPGEFQTSIPPYLRAINADYTYHRPQYRNGVKVADGYSIGYNLGLDWLGGIWRLRGWDIKCAANLGWNEWTIAVLCLVDGKDPLTELALRSMRYIHHEANKRAKRTLAIRPHSQLDDSGAVLPWPGNQTACCGDGIRAQMRVGEIQGGKLNWTYYHPTEPVPIPPTPTPIPPTPTPTPPTDIDMDTEEEMPFLVKNNNGETAIIYGSGKMTGLAGPDIPEFEEAFGKALPISDATVWADFASKGKA